MIKFMRMELLSNHIKAWTDIIDLQKFTDQDIQMIIMGYNNPSSDKARRAILKSRTYESDIYIDINYANITRKRTAI